MKEGSEMTQGWSSDWEKLFAKCVADEGFRRDLLAALDQGIDNTAIGLLDSIGIGGSADQRSARVNALKAVREPLGAAAHAFGSDLQALAAP
jgi:hypothetical protein